MTVSTTAAPRAIRARGARSTAAGWLDRENVVGYILMKRPGAAATDRVYRLPVRAGRLVQHERRQDLRRGRVHRAQELHRSAADSGGFQQTLKNSFVYTGSATVFKLGLGLGLALVMNQAFPFRAIIRASVLLPYIVPTALSTLAFVLIFHATLTPLPWLFRPLGIPFPASGFLGDPALAMASVIFVNIWRGTPFAISLLAGLQPIPQDLYEAASIDGANAWDRFWHITIPLLLPVLTIVMLFSIIQTFSDFQIVQVLTRGGPTDTTHLFGTLSYQIGLQGGRLGQGAAVSLFMLPFLGLLVIAQLWYTRRNASL